MKGYYLTGAGIGLLLAIIMFIVGNISNCAARNSERDRVGDYEDYYTVRYYTGDEATSGVKYALIEEGEYLNISTLPTKSGYIFAGLYDNKNYQNATMYVDSQGEGLVGITRDIVLYPIFVED